MPKLKTHKGTKRRVKVTGTGKLMVFPAGRRHLLTGKSGRTNRRMRKRYDASSTDAEKLRRLLPYS